jgi:predicted transglutaminase-like cysteine proteinase
MQIQSQPLTAPASAPVAAPPVPARPLAAPTHPTATLDITDQLQQATPATQGSSRTHVSMFSDTPRTSRDERYQALLSELRGKPELFQVNRVNTFFNDEIRYTSDQANQGVKDYWQTPRETLKSGKGDCEDYAIAKYQALKELGIPESRLHMMYVKADQTQAHMVLGYKDTNQQSLILDNLSTLALPPSKRVDLTPVFSFNPKGVWVATGPDNWVGRQLKNDPSQITKYQDVLQRMNRGL